MLDTLTSYAYTQIRPWLKPKSPLVTNFPHGKTIMAVICDSMTWHNLRHGYGTILLTPRNWHDAFSYDIDLFFCEAAWSGAEDNCWRGQIYKDRRVHYENRRTLLKILSHCSSKNIPSVFWAKEDPTYFQNNIYDFTDTAQRFDCILTTAAECVPMYHKLGHENVHVWPFGFSPSIFYPPKINGFRQEVAIFAGGWYDNHIQRCKDLSELFDMVLDKGITLKIYDRYREFGYSSRPFPQKYQYFVYDSIPYESLGHVYRDSSYIINVNTVCDSSTMFARRVYEAMACGCIVISNDSVGIRQQFGKNIWYLKEDFNFSQIENIRQANINMVYKHHTWLRRIEQLQEILKLWVTPSHMQSFISNSMYD